MAEAATLLINACDSEIKCLGNRQLLIVIAQALAGNMTAQELLDDACDSGIDCLNEKQLLVVIAQSVSGTGGIGGSGVLDDGTTDPVAAPSNPAVTNWYTNTATGTAWVWPAGGSAWQQIV